ncbi:cobalt transporter [Bifidobacterium thermophilum]|uniref:Cobalt transporter n=1 Tax=Bifidobacterium thermophilum TaxID=33905 RepID=A0A2N3QMF3_9BIFI|nr:energy-coupling factor transporter transmembrane component T [Bifidobacterium thermophilum]PKU89897.1 cobalt transporter [Bifidobacterium thermophilum]PKU92861.1 cobalt transporter [Bifidobacterium thermophilum]
MDADLYVPGNGWLHRVDPRVKFLISLVLLVLCLIWRSWPLMLAALILEHLMLLTDHIPWKNIAWVWKILAVIIVLIVVLWPIFDRSGTHVLVGWGWLRLTRENLLMAAVMGLRIPALGFACFLTLFTTSQAKLIRGAVALGMPYSAGLTLATALRYIPVFARIVTQVRDAQRARGLDLSGEGARARGIRNPCALLLARARAWVPVIVAVLIRAYRMSRSVGWAMESRGLGLPGVKRSYRVRLSMRPADWAIAAVTMVCTAGALVAMAML